MSWWGDHFEASEKDVNTLRDRIAANECKSGDLVPQVTSHTVLAVIAQLPLIVGPEFQKHIDPLQASINNAVDQL